MFHTLYVMETADEIDLRREEEGSLCFLLTVKAVADNAQTLTLKQLWERRIELPDVLEGRVLLLSRDEVPYLAEVDDVQESSDRGADKVLVTLR